MSVWLSSSKKKKVENFMLIDTKFLKAGASLSAKSMTTIKRVRKGTTIDSVDIFYGEGMITLIYQSYDVNNQWHLARQQIDILSTPCNYGGFRKWFECPDCCNRVGTLARKYEHFACRKCHDLVYSSQYESKYARLIRAQEKLRRRIFEDCEKDGCQKRKKGMHQATFNNIHQQYLKVNSEAYGVLGKLLGFGVEI